MPKTLWLQLLPDKRPMQELVFQGAITAVIDVLRATTTITTALSAGAVRVIPCSTILQAKNLARKLQRQGVDVCLAGERNGKKIPGFDKGNSPAEFKALAGKTVILTTSNGTKALNLARRSKWVLATCLNNLRATAVFLVREAQKKMIILMAGEAGKRAEEDILAAGLLVKELIAICRQQKNILHLDSEMEIAYSLAQVVGQAGLIEKYLMHTPHGQDLVHLGFATDIYLASRLNTTTLVGILTPQGIRAAGEFIDIEKSL